MKSNFELVSKCLSLSDALNLEVYFFSDHRAEFLMAEAAVSILLKCPIDLNDKLFNCTTELIASQFMDEFRKSSKDDYISMSKQLADKFLKLLVELSEVVISPWESGGEREFFFVVNKYFPDGACYYFRKNFAQYFSEPLAASY